MVDHFPHLQLQIILQFSMSQLWKYDGVSLNRGEADLDSILFVNMAQKARSSRAPSAKSRM